MWKGSLSARSKTRSGLWNRRTHDRNLRPTPKHRGFFPGTRAQARLSRGRARRSPGRSSSRRAFASWVMDFGSPQSNNQHARGHGRVSYTRTARSRSPSASSSSGDIKMATNQVAIHGSRLGDAAENARRLARGIRAERWVHPVWQRPIRNPFEAGACVALRHLIRVGDPPMLVS
jgi:hypothetical protein